MLFLNTDTIKRSFRKAREDMDALRTNITEWLMFLNKRQDEQEARIRKLEQHIFELEQEKIV